MEQKHGFSLQMITSSKLWLGMHLDEINFKRVKKQHSEIRRGPKSLLLFFEALTRRGAVILHAHLIL